MTEKSTKKDAVPARKYPHSGGSYRVGPDGTLIKNKAPTRTNTATQETGK